MSTTEIYIPPTSDDFEAGDRLYHYRGFSKGELGTVKSVHADYLLVQMDDGSMQRAPIDNFSEDRPEWEWDKLVRLEDIQVGSVLSQKDYRSKRKFARVFSVMPGKAIRAEFISGVTPAEMGKTMNFIGADPEDNTSLERKLLGWSLEG